MGNFYLFFLVCGQPVSDAPPTQWAPEPIPYQRTRSNPWALTDVTIFPPPKKNKQLSCPQLARLLDSIYSQKRYKPRGDNHGFMKLKKTIFGGERKSRFLLPKIIPVLLTIHNLCFNNGPASQLQLSLETPI